MGVARDTSAVVDSVPPTDAGGNIDINDLTIGSTPYLPVQVPGAMFFSGGPHTVQGDGAMKTAVRRAMVFVTEDVGLAGPVAHGHSPTSLPRRRARTGHCDVEYVTVRCHRLR